MSNRAKRCGYAVLLCLLAAICGTAGCTHANKRLSPLSVPLESRELNQTRASLEADIVALDSQSRRAVTAARGVKREFDVHPDGVFVGVAISGGGSRSANFSAACFFQLQKLGLLQRTDYISSVSGGSLTAAYYCSHGEDDGWNPKTLQQKMSRSFATDAIIQTLLPWNMLTLLLTDYDRSDVIAGIFDSSLFQREKGGSMTYADLRPDRPRLLINATDLQSGKKFIFCNETFDQINSDLSQYPLAYAVTASSAVPVLMHQVTLRDYTTIWNQYRHLIDGGVVDNLGVQTLVETYAAHISTAEAAKMPDPYPGGAILLVIDARTEFDSKLSDKSDIGLLEGLMQGASLTSTALVNRASNATLAEIIVRYADDGTPVEELRELIRKLNQTGAVTVIGRNKRPVRVVHIALSHMEDVSNLPSQGFREHLNRIQTYFNISPGEAFDLYQAADLLIRERFEPELRRLSALLDGGKPVKQ